MADILEEQIYVIPLRDVKRAPRWKRSQRAVKEIRAYLEKHLKSDDVKIDQDLNEKLWERGSQKPPRKVRVRAMKFEDGHVEVALAEETEVQKEKKRPAWIRQTETPVEEEEEIVAEDEAEAETEEEEAEAEVADEEPETAEEEETETEVSEEEAPVEAEAEETPVSGEETGDVKEKTE